MDMDVYVERDYFIWREWFKGLSKSEYKRIINMTPTFLSNGHVKEGEQE